MTEKNTEYVTITKDEYRRLEEQAMHMWALEVLGVDNWQGYVGPKRSCEQCGEYNTWEKDDCSECNASLPEPYDLI